METVTIKKFQSMRTLDGGGYSYDLYIDGKKVAFVMDEGHGGAVFARWANPEDEKKFLAYIEALPVEPLAANAEDWEKELYPNGHKVTDEDFYARLADQYEAKKFWIRKCKKNTLYRLPADKPEQYRILNRPFTPELKAKILAKHPEAKFVNEEVLA